MVSLIYQGHAFGFPCIHISDRWLKIMDIHNSVMDTIILNYGQVFIGKHVYPQLFAFGIPSIHIPDQGSKLRGAEGQNAPKLSPNAPRLLNLGAKFCYPIQTDTCFVA